LTRAPETGLIAELTNRNGVAMKKPFALSLVAVLLALQPADATVLRGKWHGIADASLELLPENMVNYCYGDTCWTVQFSGNPNRKIRFRVGDAHYEFAKTATGYHGIYDDPNGDPAEIDLK